MGAVRTRAGRGRAVPWVVVGLWLAALVAMTTLLPAVLVLLGLRVFWPLIPAFGSEPRARRSLFAAMGTSAARRPAAVLAGGAVLLGTLGVDYGIFLMHRMREESLAPPGRECPRISKGVGDRSVRTSRWG